MTTFNDMMKFFKKEQNNAIKFLLRMSKHTK